MSTIRDDRLYDKTHEWVKITGEEAIIGISDHAQHALGDITYVDLPEPGAEVSQGQEFGSIESVKAASDLISPVSGEVIAINETLADAPQNCNSDPYGDGWMIKVKLSEQPSELLDAKAYEAHCANEK